MTEILRLAVTLLLFVIVLGGIVLVHEVGHYITAKLTNVRVLEFGIGFPPRARVLRAKGETLWTLNWLPLGGFVKLDGEDGDANDPRSFSAKSLPVRLGILVAGVVMNVVLALVIFVGIAWGATPLGIEVPQVQAGSPASRAGIVAGDTLVSLNGEVFDLYSGGILTAIRTHPGEVVTLGIRHADGSTENVAVTLRSTAELDLEHGPLGVQATEARPFRSISLTDSPRRTFGDAIRVGANDIGRWSGLIFDGLSDLVRSFIDNPTAPPPAAGPIGIAQQIGDVFFGIGWEATLYMAGILSINLAVVNILPFPPLDGGRMFVLVIKRLFGRRVSLRAERVTYFVGFVFLLAFIVWISGFDIIRLGNAP
jgi:regulator of sigma E protease